jgi:hypothetical protein
MSVFSSAWSVAAVIFLQQKWRQNIVSDHGSIDRWVLKASNNDGDNTDKNHIEKAARD